MLGDDEAEGGEMNLATKKLKDLLPADYNPRKDLQPGDPEYESLKKSIKRWGLVEPIVWNKHTGHVCGGHQRLKVLLAEGVKETEVVVVDLPEKEEKALNLALNKIRGDWDYEKLMFILDELAVAPPEGFDIEMAGFSKEEVGNIIMRYTGNNDDIYKLWKGMPEYIHEDKTAYRSIIVHFKDEKAVQLFAKKTGQKITPKTKYLWYPEIEIEKIKVEK